MLFNMSKIMMLLSIIFSTSSHPMLLIILIILLSIIMSFYMFMMIKFSWMSFIFCLLMIGGMMILFIYMSSLSTSNYPFFINKMLLIISLIMIFPQPKMNFMMNFKFQKIEFILSPMTNNNMLFLITYLIFVIIMLIELTKTWKLPFRSN